MASFQIKLLLVFPILAQLYRVISIRLFIWSETRMLRLVLLVSLVGAVISFPYRIYNSVKGF